MATQLSSYKQPRLYLAMPHGLEHNAMGKTSKKALTKKLHEPKGSF